MSNNESTNNMADPTGRTVYDVGLRLNACWDRGFQSHGGIDVSLLWVFVLSGRRLCDGLIPRPEESYRMWCVFERDQVEINNLDTYCE
jgi:hypothetical protein